jgi:hypothetical protein
MDNLITPEKMDLDTLEKAHDALKFATVGSWTYLGDYYIYKGEIDTKNIILQGRHQVDLEFVVTLKDLAPKLLAHIDAQQEEIFVLNEEIRFLREELFQYEEAELQHGQSQPRAA